MFVRVKHLRLPVADPIHGQLVQRFKHQSLLLVLYAININPDIHKFRLTLLHLDIFKRIKLLFVCSQGSSESRNEIFNVCFDVLLQTIFSTLETFDED